MNLNKTAFFGFFIFIVLGGIVENTPIHAFDFIQTLESDPEPVTATPSKFIQTLKAADGRMGSLLKSNKIEEIYITIPIVS